MTTTQLPSLLHHLRRLASPSETDGCSDGELLARFVAHKEPEAFEALLRRHGPMVYGVCRRILGQCQDAEDAFQAAFLVLVKRADAVAPPGLVGNWLYGVACRTALDARTKRQRRLEREQQAAKMLPAMATANPHWDDLQTVVDEELQHLDAKYRAAIVLCDLQGKSRARAAVELGVPEGTLSSRLAAGRQMLARRLARRGLALPAGLLASLLTQHALATPPPALMAGTTQAALTVAAGVPIAAGVSASVAALTHGALRAMFFSKLKVASLFVLALALAAAGTAGSLFTAGRTTPTEPEPALVAASGDKGGDKGSDKDKPTGKTDVKKSEEKKKEEPKGPSAELDKLRKQLHELEDQAKTVRRQMLAEVERELKAAQADEERIRKEGDKIRKSGKIEDIRAHIEVTRKASQRVMNLRQEQLKISSAMFHAGDGPKAPPTPEKLLGLHTESPDAALAAHLSLKKSDGRLVSAIDKDSPAATAGLKTHDVLLSIDGNAVPRGSAEFRKLLGDLKRDAAVEVVVLREGKRTTVKLSVPAGAK